MRVLIVRLTSMGDVIHTLPAVTDAARQVENIDIHWLVEESFQAIPSWHRAVSCVMTAASRRWRKQPTAFLSEFSALRKHLASQHYDLIIDAQGLLKSAMLSRVARGPRAGYDKYSIKESLASRFYDKTYAVDKRSHAVTRTRRLFADALDYTMPDSLDYGINPGQPDADADSGYLVFLHGTTWSSKQWPLENWRQLAALAAGDNLNVKLLWGNAAEHKHAMKIAAENNNAQVCPALSLDEIAVLLSAAKGVIAVDTGLGHLAAALSVPCVSIYGATDSQRTGTIGHFQRHLQAEFQCAPCLLKACNYSGHSQSVPACFDQFSAAYVWEKFKQLSKEKTK